jgi:WD40 repeat protein
MILFFTSKQEQTMNMQLSIKFLSFISVILLLSSCQGLRAYKWIENNTLYSSKAPNIEIHVNKDLQEGTDNSITTMENDLIGESHLWVKKDQYLFWDKDGNQQLMIEINNLNDDRFFMTDLTFSSNPLFLTYGQVMIEDWSFDTGIYVRAMPQQSFLVKIFGKNFGTQTRILLSYLEKIDDSWNTPDLVLNTKQKKFLEEFEKRAGKSFTIHPYSGIKPPELRNKGAVLKQ